MPLAFPEREHGGLPLVDPTLILARALIREVEPGRLREWGAPTPATTPAPGR
jgi:aspartate racemase